MDYVNSSKPVGTTNLVRAKTASSVAFRPSDDSLGKTIPTELIHKILIHGVTQTKHAAQNQAYENLTLINRYTRTVAKALRPQVRLQVASSTKKAASISSRVVDFYLDQHFEFNDDAALPGLVDFPMTKTDQKILSKSKYLTLTLLDKDLGSHLNPEMTYAYQETINFLKASAPLASGLIITAGKYRMAAPSFPNLDLSPLKNFTSLVVNGVNISVFGQVRMPLNQMINLEKVKLKNLGLYHDVDSNLASIGLHTLPKLKSLIYMDYYLEPQVLFGLQFLKLDQLETLDLGLSAYDDTSVLNEVEPLLLSMPALKKITFKSAEYKKNLLGDAFEDIEHVRRDGSTVYVSKSEPEEI